MCKKSQREKAFEEKIEELVCIHLCFARLSHKKIKRSELRKMIRAQLKGRKKKLLLAA